MASQSTTEPPPNQEMCHLCQLPVPGAAKHEHEKGLHHQAALKIAAVALDRWRVHLADKLPWADLQEDADALVKFKFCDICTEVVPSDDFPQHLTSRHHLISALDSQVFEELVRAYVDEDDLELLEEQNYECKRVMCYAWNEYTCHICALEVAKTFKKEHELSIHHRTRVALATAAARRTSAFLHNQTPIGVRFKSNKKMTELLKLYTGIDLREAAEEKDVIDKEVEEKSSQVEIKKRMTSKQYFTDILPYLQYTETLYTIIVDDTEYVTIKNTNGTCMRVHVANFNGIYSDSSDVHYDLKCRMCNGYNQYMTYSSEKDHDKLHVMSLGHIRHVLTPIDNVHGIRKIDNGQALCVVCNAFMPEHAIENHIFNDIHHTAALAEALKLGKKFKESKNDLKIVIYTSPPVEKTNYTRNPIRNFPHNNVYFGGGICLPHGGNVSLPQGGPISKPQGGLFVATNAGPASTDIVASIASGTTFGSNPANVGFGASTANTGTTFGSGPASTGTIFGNGPANTGFGASTASTGKLGSSLASTGTFGSNPANVGFGVSTASTGTFFGSGPANTGFGTSTASTGKLGSSLASTGTFGSNPANVGFGVSTASTGTIFGSGPANTGFGASTASTGTIFGSDPAKTGFGASTGIGSGPPLRSPSTPSFAAKPASTGVFGSAPANNGIFGASNGSTVNNVAFGAYPGSTLD